MGSGSIYFSCESPPETLSRNVRCTVMESYMAFGSKNTNQASPKPAAARVGNRSRNRIFQNFPVEVRGIASRNA